MGNYSTRLGCTLSFNEESEKDVIKLVEQLQGSRKIGEFIGYLLRIAAENPELLDKRNDGSVDYGSAVKEMARLGVSPTRYQYIQAMNKEIDNLKQKIDAIYEMSFKMYTLAQFGKQLGLEKRSDNMLMASFLAEQEVAKICSTFGIGELKSVFASNKLEAAHTKADDTLKYIIETYDGIVNEIRDMVFKEVQIKTEPLKFETKPLELKAEPIKLDVQLNGLSAGNVDVRKQEVSAFKAELDDEQDGEDSVLDFGVDEQNTENDENNEEDVQSFSEDNLDLMSAFFGAD